MLLAPGYPPPGLSQSLRPPSVPTAPPLSRPPQPSLPPGFRWIAVRPGPPPQPRYRQRRPEPTPRYRAIPQWTLFDPATTGTSVPEDAGSAKTAILSYSALRAVGFSAVVVFGCAALVHMVSYGLLLVNRTVLLPTSVATIASGLEVVVSLTALSVVILTAVVLTSWLIQQRRDVFERRGHSDPRSARLLWLGCMTPGVNLIWAPVFVIELARAQNVYAQLRHRITAWWVSWIVATAISLFATVTSFSTAPQSVANNTVSVIIADLAGLVTVLLLWRLVSAFYGTFTGIVTGVSSTATPRQPAHRWVIFPDDHPIQATAGSTTSELIRAESTGESPI